MTENQDKINQLLAKLDTLLKRQDDFSREINNLKVEINSLKTAETEQTTNKEETTEDRPLTHADLDTTKEKVSTDHEYRQQEQKKPERVKRAAPPINKPPKTKSDLEKFIGENLISKIGIVITVIGVAIGAKYSIEHDLVSPLTRIILGYLTGLGLLGFGMKLKKKYENYSAVLVSGAMAIMYFITYSAYSFYNLVPQAMAFTLMAVFTAFTVVAAINYNR